MPRKPTSLSEQLEHQIRLKTEAVERLAQAEKHIKDMLNARPVMLECDHFHHALLDRHCGDTYCPCLKRWTTAVRTACDFLCSQGKESHDPSHT